MLTNPKTSLAGVVLLLLVSGAAVGLIPVAAAETLAGLLIAGGLLHAQDGHP